MKTGRLKIIFLAMIAAVCMTAIVGCNADAGRTAYKLTYGAGEGGYISGAAEQEVKEGKDGETVIAIAKSGYTFVKWSDGITSVQRKERAVKEDREYTAYFTAVEAEPVYHTLSYGAGEGGYISGTAEQEVREGRNGQYVTATADEGFKFVRWSDGITTARRQDKRVTADKSATAEFAPLECYILSYGVEEGGYIEGETEQSVMELTNGKPVTAKADSGYKFVKWSDGITTAQRQDRTVTADKSATAEFALLEYYTLSYSAGEGGYIKGETEQSVMELTNGAKVTAVPEQGYVFSMWSDGLFSASRQERSVKGDKTVTACFERIPIYTLKYSVFSSGYGYIEGETTQNVYIEGETTQSVLEGDNGTTVTAVANEHFEFKGWSDGVKSASRKDVAVYSDKEVTAYFSRVYFRYKYSVDPECGRIEGDTEQWVYRNETGTEVTAVPNEGYIFIGWSDGVTTLTRQDSGCDFIGVKARFIKGREINYRVNNGIGGSIEGTAKQYILGGGETTAVKAVADEGYEFAGWSDGTAEAERNDKDVGYEFTVTAYFEPKEKVFRYDYRGATANAAVKTVTVKRADPKASVFAVPQKEGYDFVGWYADENYATRITDEYGGLMYGYNRTKESHFWLKFNRFKGI